MSVITTYQWINNSAAYELLNVPTIATEETPVVTATIDGNGFLGAWVTHAFNDSVRARLADGHGAATAGELDPSAGLTVFETDPALATLHNGNYVAAFTDNAADGGVRVRLLGSNGQLLGPETLLHPGNPAFSDLDPDIAVLSDGRFAVTWTRWLSNSDTDIRFALFNENGSLITDTGVVNVAVDVAESSSVAALAGGKFVTVWQSHTAGNNAVYFRHFDAAGQPLDGSNTQGVLIDNIGDNTDIHVAGLVDGGFVVTYTDTGWGISGTEITARIYNANGTPRTGQFLVNAGVTVGDQDHASVTALSDNSFAISWNSNNTDDYIAAFDADGTARTPATKLATHAIEGDIAALKSGFIAHVFESKDPDLTGSESIRANVFELTRTVTGDDNGNSLQGYDLRNTLIGLGGDDTLFGGKGQGTLYGNEGNDQLYSLYGNDTMYGGTGDDIYYFYGTDIELPGEGHDTVYTHVFDYVLPANIEDLYLDITSGATNGYGNELDNVITGNQNANLLKGGDGNDTLCGEGKDDILDGGEGDDTAVYFQTLDKFVLTDFGSKITVSSFNLVEGNDTLFSIEHLKFADGTIDLNDGNALFDTAFYMSHNLDVFHAGVNALGHFNASGWHEGRDPNAFFSVNQYLGANPDVKASGMNPLDHYDQIGWQQGRDPSANFDTKLYLIHNPDVAAAGIDPLAHYLANGMAEGRQAYAAIGTAVNGFDAEYYLMHNPDVAAAGVDPLAHFNANGWHEGRNPNAWFDTAGYLAHYADIAAAGINPLTHYEQFGWQEGRDPSAGFDTNGYLAANPDVAAAHINPLDHFINNGIYEGRVAVNDGLWH